MSLNPFGAQSPATAQRAPRNAPGRFVWHPRNPSAPLTALVTGASAGIGAEFARQLAGRGFDLLLVARRATRLTELARTIEAEKGVRCTVLAADLAQETGVAQVEAAIRQLDNLAILVNNAGFGTVGQFVRSDPLRQQEMVYLHVMAAMRLTQAALPALLHHRYGALINVSSVAAYIRLRGNVNYSATKAFLNAFSETLHYELHGTGVFVQALCPGFTHTEFHSTPDYQNFKPHTYPAFMWQSAQTVVQRSLDAVGNGQVIYVPSLLYRALVLALQTPVLGETMLRVGGRLAQA